MNSLMTLNLSLLIMLSQRLKKTLKSYIYMFLTALFAHMFSVIGNYEAQESQQRMMQASSLYFLH